MYKGLNLESFIDLDSDWDNDDFETWASAMMDRIQFCRIPLDANVIRAIGGDYPNLKRAMYRLMKNRSCAANGGCGKNVWLYETE